MEPSQDEAMSLAHRSWNRVRKDNTEATLPSKVQQLEASVYGSFDSHYRA